MATMNEAEVRVIFAQLQQATTDRDRATATRNILNAVLNHYYSVSDTDLDEKVMVALEDAKSSIRVAKGGAK
jgi:hypothetical protein